MKYPGLLLLAIVVSSTAAWAQPFKIGVLVPLSGDGSRSYGEHVKNGVLLAKRHHGAEPISLVFEDSQCDAKTAIAAAQKLITIDKVQAIIGDVCWTDIIAPIAERNHVPVISTGSAQSAVRNAGDYIFRLKLDVAVDSKELARTLRQEFGYTRAAVVYVGDQWGEGIAENFSNEFSARSGAIVSRALYRKDERDFRALLLNLKKENPDVVVLAGYPENIGILARQLRDLGIRVPLAAYRGGLGAETLELGGAAVDGLVYIEEFDMGSRRESVLFAEEYLKAYGQEANLFSAMGYDAYMLYRQAAASCGTKASCIKDFLYGVKDFAGVSGIFNFDSFGDVQKSMALYTIADGKFVAYSAALLAGAENRKRAK